MLKFTAYVWLLFSIPLKETSTFIRIERLPPPYDTNCLDYETLKDVFTHRIDAISKCITRDFIRIFNKLPFSEIIVDSQENQDYSQYKILDSEDFKNETIKPLTEIIKNRCLLKYARFDCLEHFSITRIYDYASRSENQIGFRIDLPNHPYFLITYRAKLEFFAYLIYVLSCLGIWFGFKFLQLDPVELYKLWNSKNKVSRRIPLYNLYQRQARKQSLMNEQIQFLKAELIKTNRKIN